MPRGLDEFVKQVEFDGECWTWTGEMSHNGYGRFIIEYGGRGKPRIRQAAHRWLYHETVEKLDDKVTLDHLCRNRLCVNPDHLEPVSIGENIRRGGNAAKTACKWGHPLAGDNLYMTPDGRRQCRICLRKRSVSLASGW